VISFTPALSFYYVSYIVYITVSDVILTRSGSLDTGYGDLDDATSSEGR